MISCGMHIMRDKYISSIWRGNINTYRVNTYRVFRADKLHDIISPISYVVASKLYHIESYRNDLVRDAYHAG